MIVQTTPSDGATPFRTPVDGPFDQLRAAGVLRDVDVHFARVAARLAGESDPLVMLGMAAASRAPGAGHACVDLARPERLVRAEPGARGREAATVTWPVAAVWRAALAGSAAVALPAEYAAGGRRPLVLDGDRLYLARHWEYERRLVTSLGARAARRCAGVDETALAAGLDRLFPPLPNASPADAPDGQRVAAATAVRRHFAVITGGPGTGKTTTVCRLLALLAEQALTRDGVSPRIVLAAPTGKAAARLAESVCAGIAALSLAVDVAAAIPRVATTLHRLLGWQPRTPTRFRHGADLPLPADVVVVDEASMVDLALMAKLVDAVAPDARLILLGDRDQLASVEAGSVLADLCGGDEAQHAAHTWAHTWSNAPDDGAPPVAACVVRLTRNYRYDGQGAIGRLATAVNAGDADEALAVLRAGAADASGTDGVAFVELADGRAGEAQAARACARAATAYARASRSRGPKEALDAFDALRILSAHRSGAWGVGGLNDAVVRHLAGTGDLPADAGARSWYHGQPVLITENDPSLELFNGDVGVVLADGDGRTLRAWFRSGTGAVRGVAPARLPAHETVYAMTVHKSQGSQFDAVVLVLPPRPSPVLTRELLYTGVSRARRRVTVVGSEATLRAGIAERVQRSGGMRDALWGAGVIA